jgi:secreted trypsin-like serine protease
MNILLKTKILLVAAAAGAAGSTTVGAQAQSQRLGRESFRIDGDVNATVLSQKKSSDGALRGDSITAAVPEVASIVNGTSTGGPLPYMVGLAKRGFNSVNFFVNCGGTLINPTTVLTAAHCMHYRGKWNSIDHVLVNLYDRYDAAGVVTINIQDPSEGGKDIVVHPHYNDGAFLNNDIALIFLPVGQVADYAKQNNDPHEPVEDDPLRVMGWGRTKSGASTSDVLLETTVDYISNKECQEAYADITAQYPIYMITDGMMCTYREYTAVCSGDSGGPLFQVDKDEDGEIGDRPTQVGITSWGIPCAFPGRPDVYTRVSYYSEWIKETVCSRPEHATKELCGSSKSGKSTKSSSYSYSYTP